MRRTVRRAPWCWPARTRTWTWSPSPTTSRSSRWTLFIGDREHRRQEGLCHDIGLKPYMGGRKIAIIDDADYLNAEGANCLLKTLEEPPPRSVLILIGTSPAKQLAHDPLAVPTDPLPAAAGRRWWPSCSFRNGLVADPAEARAAGAVQRGQHQRAVELADPGLWSFRSTLVRAAGRAGAGQRAGSARAWRRLWTRPARRPRPAARRLRQIVAFAAEFYRHLLHAQSGAACPDDAELRPLRRTGGQRWPGNANRPPRASIAAWTPPPRSTATPTRPRSSSAWLDDLAAA